MWKGKQRKEMLLEEIPVTRTKQWKDNILLLDLASAEATPHSHPGLCVHYTRIHRATHPLLSTNGHHHPLGQKLKWKWRNWGYCNKANQHTGQEITSLKRTHFQVHLFIHQLTVIKGNVLLKHWPGYSFCC